MDFEDVAHSEYSSAYRFNTPSNAVAKLRCRRFQRFLSGNVNVQDVAGPEFCAAPILYRIKQ